MCAHVCHVSGVSCVERRPESGRVRYGCWQPAAVGQVLSALLGMSREDIKAAPSWLSVQELAECARIRVARARDDDGRPCSNGLRDRWRGSLWAWRGVLYACALCGVSMLLSSMRAIACPCEQGMEEAQYALGMLYLGGGDVQGMRQDVGKGLHWIRKAASKDHGAPCAARVCTVCGQCVASVWGASHLLRAVPSTARIRPIWPAAPCSRQQRPSAAPFSPPRASGQKRLRKRAAWCSSVSPVRAPPVRVACACCVLARHASAAGAQYELAKCWRLGRGVDKDEGKALLWLRKVPPAPRRCRVRAPSCIPHPPFTAFARMCALLSRTLAPAVGSLVAF